MINENVPNVPSGEPSRRRPGGRGRLAVGPPQKVGRESLAEAGCMKCGGQVWCLNSAAHPLPFDLERLESGESYLSVHPCSFEEGDEREDSWRASVRGAMREEARRESRARRSPILPGEMACEACDGPGRGCFMCEGRGVVCRGCKLNPCNCHAPRPGEGIPPES